MRSETEAAIRSAAIAQRLVDSRNGADRVTSKGGIDLVTATDVLCEDAIRAELTSAFPDYPIVGEEHGGSPVAGRPYWLVDPICGTRTYASDVPLYCTNIALVENGVVTLAVVGLGRTGEILYAERGAGARMRTTAGETAIASAAHSQTIWICGKTEHAANVIRRAVLLDRWYICLFPSSLAYAYVAAGRMSGILHFESASPVHTAAGCLVAGEAGAVVTDLEGRPWTLDAPSVVVAATHSLHQELIDLVGRCR